MNCLLFCICRFYIGIARLPASFFQKGTTAPVYSAVNVMLTV